jgi:hypothetical protein
MKVLGFVFLETGLLTTGDYLQGSGFGVSRPGTRRANRMGDAEFYAIAALPPQATIFFLPAPRSTTNSPSAQLDAGFRRFGFSS